jgi:hypothetical protein
MLPNEIDYSLSANVGFTYREDVEPRLRIVDLAFDQEDANKRVFPNPFLHDWIRENRVKIISSIAALYRHWIKEGSPLGQTPFTSFPRWAEVVGGVMKAAGLGDPCLPHEGEELLGGDRKERAMRALYCACYAEFPETWMKKADIYDVIKQQLDNYPGLEWFGDLTSEKDKRAAATRTGNALSAFKKRILNDTRLVIDTSLKNTQQWRYKFTKTL